jgi:hypothetical protein
MCRSGRLGDSRASGRSHGDGGASFRRGCRSCDCRRSYHDRAGRRLGGDGRGLLCRRRGHNGGCRARLRNNFTRSRPGSGGRWRRLGRLCSGWFGLNGWLCGLRRGRRGPASGSFLFFFLLYSLENVARFRHVRKVYLGFGRSVSPRGGRRAGFATLEVGTYTVGLIGFKRTGVGLLLSNPYGFKNIENGSALNFQFTR